MRVKVDFEMRLSGCKSTLQVNEILRRVSFYGILGDPNDYKFQSGSKVWSILLF